MAKTRLNISLDKDLVEFIKVFAEENRITVADIITQYVLGIKRNVEGEAAEKILSHKSFEDAMIAVQKRLRDGTAVWHSYDEVFDGD